MLENFLRQIRQHPLYKKAFIFFCPEHQGEYTRAAFYASVAMQQEFQPLYVISRDSTGQGRPGVPTGPIEKILYVAALNRILNDQTIHFAESMLLGYDYKEKKAVNKEEAMIKKLLEQIKNYHRVTKIPRHEDGTPYKQYLTGKMRGMSDDVVICVQLTTHYMEDEQEKPVFQRLRRVQGWY